MLSSHTLKGHLLRSLVAPFNNFVLNNANICKTSNKSYSKITKYFEEFHQDFSPVPVVYRDLVACSLAKSINLNSSSKKTIKLQKELLTEIEATPVLDNDAVIHQLSSFDVESRVKNSEVICPAAAIGWKTLLPKMGHIIELDGVHFSGRSYRAFIMELLKVDSVRSLCFSRVTFKDQHVDDSIYQLMNMLRKQKKDSPLQELLFISSKLGDEGCNEITEALREGLLCNVKRLILHDNEIGNDPSLLLCEAAALRNNSLMELDLSLNYLDDYGVKLAEMASMKKPHLEVNLTANNIKWAS